jgi:hypothetical protein
MEMSEKSQKAIIILVTALIAVAIVWTNTYMRCVKYYQKGEELLGQGELLQAVTNYETAAHAYAPFNGYVAKSLNRLWEIGEKMEAEHQAPENPLIAYRTLRSSVYAIRSFYEPYKEWIPRCDKKISALVDIQKKQ